ncbi:iron-sulfur cluster assembly 2 homolog, mitochondrial-like [Convolutriloba macropyga]|uniref:iron-sulfur cluster assembly 2 homolog, mitochondrial-like n=1 Tax=Convolutriloba macropyga TaxID=536237 RepID=UPI003F51DD83
MLSRVFPKSWSGIKRLSASAEPALRLTKASIEKLEQKCTSGYFLRIFVDGGGCSGFQYCFEMDKSLNDDDVKVEHNGKCVVAVDSESINFVRGSLLDYQDELIRSAFRIAENPNASKEGACSCGASFNLNANFG